MENIKQKLGYTLGVVVSGVIFAVFLKEENKNFYHILVMVALILFFLFCLHKTVETKKEEDEMQEINEWLKEGGENAK